MQDLAGLTVRQGFTHLSPEKERVELSVRAIHKLFLYGRKNPSLFLSGLTKSSYESDSLSLGRINPGFSELSRFQSTSLRTCNPAYKFQAKAVRS